MIQFFYSCLPLSRWVGFDSRPSLICGPLECGLLSVTKKFRRKIKVVLNYWRTFKFHLEFFLKRKKTDFKIFQLFSNFFLFHLEGEGFGFLPVEVWVFTSKMSIRWCFLENGFFQIQIPKEKKNRVYLWTNSWKKNIFIGDRP